MDLRFTVDVHEEDGILWGQVREWPGCFASGDDLDELSEAINEAINLQLDSGAVTPEMLEAARDQSESATGESPPRKASKLSEQFATRRALRNKARHGRVDQLSILVDAS
jgi:predicted RNase H-like HicB family nuclease